MCVEIGTRSASLFRNGQERRIARACGGCSRSAAETSSGRGVSRQPPSGRPHDVPQMESGNTPYRGEALFGRRTTMMPGLDRGFGTCSVLVAALKDQHPAARRHAHNAITISDWIKALAATISPEIACPIFRHRRNVEALG